MNDQFAADAKAAGDDPAIVAMLKQICEIIGMGFAVVARVTETRWVACQVEDRIGLGVGAGDDVDITKTICERIRDTGEAVVIDDVAADPEWRAHPVPAIYGFQSYVAIPVRLPDGSFYGTLCALDPQPRNVSASNTIPILEHFAQVMGTIISKRTSSTRRSG